MANDNPSLLMWRPDIPLADYAMPDGYAIRPLQPGEEAAWCECMLGDMGVQEASEAQYLQKMDDETVHRGCVYMIESANGDIVATATAQVKGENAPWLHMVSVHPNARGRGLAKPLVATVLRHHTKAGRAGCYLLTQEHRTAAVKLYLDLGFMPVMSHPSYRKKFEQLAFDYALPRIACVNEDKTPCEDILPHDYGLVFVDD